MNIFYGWWIVAASIVVYIYNGGTYAYGLTAFFNPISTEFGWTRAETSLGFSLRSVEIGLVDPLIGLFIDRFGARWATILGVVIVSFGMLFMSRIDSLPMFYAALLTIAVGAALGFGIAQYAAIANWFVRRRGLAMGLLSTGYGVCGVLVPVVAMLIEAIGWRSTMVVLAVVWWIIGAPLALVMRHRPEPYGYLPDGGRIPRSQPQAVAANEPTDAPMVIQSGPMADGLTARQALRTRSFWLFSVFYLFTGFAQAALGVHEMPYLTSIGISTELAALTMTGITVSSLTGRLGFAWLGDYVDKRLLVAAAAALQTVGIVIFALIGEPWHLLLFLATYGPGYGAPIPLIPALQADYFGVRAFAVTRGLLAAGWSITGFTAPLTAGWTYDVSGSYRLFWLVSGAISACGVPVALAMRMPAPKAADRPSR